MSIKIVNLQDAYDYIENKTGLKIIESSFEDNTSTVQLTGATQVLDIVGTLSFNVPETEQMVCIDGVKYEGSVNGSEISITGSQSEILEVIDLCQGARRLVPMVDQKGRSFVACPVCIEEVGSKEGEKCSVTFTFGRAESL